MLTTEYLTSSQIYVQMKKKKNTETVCLHGSQNGEELHLERLIWSDYWHVLLEYRSWYCTHRDDDNGIQFPSYCSTLTSKLPFTSKKRSPHLCKTSSLRWVTALHHLNSRILNNEVHHTKQDSLLVTLKLSGFLNYSTNVLGKSLLYDTAWIKPWPT